VEHAAPAPAAQAAALIPAAVLIEGGGPRWVYAGAPSLHALAFALVGALSFLAARVLRLDSPLLGLFACPVRAATGVPCPGCGGTHALLLLAHGEPLAALYASPLAALAVALLWASAVITLLRLAGLRRAVAIPALARASRSPASMRLLRLALLGALLANWAFVIFVSRGGAR
jgi:Protein of unknown function (DUF2752)